MGRDMLPSLIAAICLQCTLVWCVPQLKLATVVYRHGDRTPIITWPTDPYANESLWPQGYGQLTVKGMAQQQFLGRLFFERYISKTYPGFLNKKYTRTQLYVRATDIDRTLMSSETQLSGLFYPSIEERFDRTLPWQPIPVHTVAMDDILLRAFDSHCPYYKQLMAATYKSPEYVDLQEQNKDLFAFLQKKTGLPSVGLGDTWYIVDTLFIESIYNRAPSWYTPKLFKKIKELADYTLTAMYNSPKKSRLSAGVFVGQLVSAMNATVTGSNNAKKMYMYSAHDTTVAAVMTALGVYNGIQPQYAAAFIVELFADNSKFFVKFFYRNETASGNIHELYIPKCGGTSCTWAQFVTYTQSLIPSDWEAECQLPSQLSSSEAGGILYPYKRYMVNSEENTPPVRG